ncbi:MAG: hypothetical protein WA441_08000 [Methyloceanibacter sp.]
MSMQQTISEIVVGASAKESAETITKLQDFDLNEDRLKILAAKIGDGLQPATRRNVIQELALLVDSRPGAATPNPECYIRLMTEDVMAAARPTVFALASACMHLRLTREWRPATAHVLEALETAEAAWRRREKAAREIVEQRSKAIATITEQQQAERQRLLDQLACLKRKREETMHLGKKAPARFPEALMTARKLGIERNVNDLDARIDWLQRMLKQWDVNL